MPLPNLKIKNKFEYSHDKGRTGRRLAQQGRLFSMTDVESDLMIETIRQRLKENTSFMTLPTSARRNLMYYERFAGGGILGIVTTFSPKYGWDIYGWITTHFPDWPEEIQKEVCCALCSRFGFNEPFNEPLFSVDDFDVPF